MAHGWSVAIALLVWGLEGRAWAQSAPEPPVMPQPPPSGRGGEEELPVGMPSGPMPEVPEVPDGGRAAPASGVPEEDEPEPASGPMPPTSVAPVAPVAAMPPVLAVRGSEKGFGWRPFGYLRVQLDQVQDDDDVAFVGRSDGFSLQNARLGVRGALGERVDFEVSIDGAVDERDRVNTPNGRLRVGLRDAFADFHLTPLRWFAPRSLTVRAGRFEALFDPDGYDGDTERAFVDRALESHGVSATQGWETAGLPPGRSLGVAARWVAWQRAAAGAEPSSSSQEPSSASSVLAEVAVQNGAGEFASANDNGALAISAALRWIAAERGWAQLAARRNTRTEGDLPFQQEERDTALSLGAGVRVGPLRLAAGGILQTTTFLTTSGPAQRAWGAHGQAMWRLSFDALDGVELGYRFAILDPSNQVVTDRLMEHTAGVVVPISALRTRVQLDATHAVEQSGRALSNDRVEVVLELRL